MAIFTPSSLVSEIRGSVGEQTYSKNASGIYVKQKLTQTVTDTSFQAIRRAAMAEAVQAYQALTDSEYIAWTEFCKENPVKNRLGVKYIRSAYNEFVSRWLNKDVVDSPALSFSPYPRVYSNLLNFAVTFGTESMEVSWLYSANVTGTALVIYATVPVSPAIRSINRSLYNVIHVIINPGVSGSLDVYDEYIARYSVSDADNGKRIGFAAKIVNTDNFADCERFYTNAIASSVFPSIPLPGENWTLRSTAANNSWRAMAYGAGLFVACSGNGSGSLRIMTSPDGITWTLRTATGGLSYRAIAYDGTQFVCVTEAVPGAVMTSPDGITWTAQTGTSDGGWQALAFGAGLFVAVGESGPTERVMTSPDGITWTARTAAVNNNWQAICFGAGLFVAVSVSGTGNRIMTSPDGITWTSRVSPADNNWSSVCYGNSLFVAVARSGTGNRVMTSPDGINWTLRTSAADNNWFAVIWTGTLFVAVAGSGTNDRVMTSPDGITWTSRNAAAELSWRTLAWDGSTLVSTSDSGTGTRAMTSV